MSTTQSDPNGDIYLAVSGDRQKIKDIVAAMAKDKPEFEELLYELWVGAFFARNITQMIDVARLIAEVKGWVVTPSGGGTGALV